MIYKIMRFAVRCAVSVGMLIVRIIVEFVLAVCVVVEWLFATRVVVETKIGKEGKEKKKV